MSVTQIDIDDEALSEAMRLMGTTTKKETVNTALREYAARVRRLEAAEKLAARAARGEFDDVIPVLTSLRDRGIKIAIVSNCTENTRAMLVATGVDKLADELVLSCEVLSAKPSPGIFRHALDRLGVSAEAALFVDDQARFCAGSVAVGIRAAQIVRGELDGQRPAEGITLVRSLSEVEAMFGE